MQVDIAIVGAGLVGSAAFRYLSQNQYQTVLIGPKHVDGSSIAGNSDNPVVTSSSDEGRIARTLEADHVWVKLAIASMARYRSIEKKADMTFYERCRCVCAAPANHPRVSGMVESAKTLKQECVVLSHEDAKRRLPWLALPKNYVAVIMDGGVINSRVMIDAQQSLGKQQSGTVIHGMNMVLNSIDVYKDVVTHIIQSSGGAEVITASGERVFAKRVLVATNAATNHTHLLSEPLALRTCTETVVLCEPAVETATLLRHMTCLLYVGEDDRDSCYILVCTR